MDSKPSGGWLRIYLVWSGTLGLLSSGISLQGAASGKEVSFGLFSAIASCASLWVGWKSADWLGRAPDRFLRGMQLVVTCDLILVPIALVTRDDVAPWVIVTAGAIWPSVLYWYAVGVANRRKAERAAMGTTTPIAPVVLSHSADAKAATDSATLSRRPRRLIRALIRSLGVLVALFGLVAASGGAYFMIDAKGQPGLFGVLLVPGALAGLYFLTMGSDAIASQMEDGASSAAWRSDLRGALYGGASGYVAGFMTARFGSGWLFGALVTAGLFAGVAVARLRRRQARHVVH